MRLPQYNFPILEKPVIGYLKLINLSELSACGSLRDYRLAKEMMLSVWGTDVGQYHQQRCELLVQKSGAGRYGRAG